MKHLLILIALLTVVLANAADLVADVRITAEGPIDAGPFSHGYNILGDLTLQDNALIVDGNSAVRLDASREFLPGTASWAVTCRFRSGQEQAGNATIVSAVWNNSRTYGLKIYQGTTLAGYMQAGPNDSVQVASVSLTEQLKDNQWHTATLVRDMTRNGELRLYFDGRDVTASPAYQPLPIITEDNRMGFIVGASAPWFVGKERTPFVGGIDRVTVHRGLPSEFAAAKDAPPPPPIPEAITDPIAQLSPQDAASQTPLSLNPETTAILLPRHMPFRSELTAAALLRDYLRWAARTDTGFDVVRDGTIPDTATAVFAVGKTRFVLPEEHDSLTTAGYLMRRKGNTIVLCGREPQDTIVAARSFLDRYAGVRFYMPTDRFTSRPVDGLQPLPAIDQLVEPAVKSTYATGFHSSPKEEQEWAERNGLLRRTGGSHQHTFYSLFKANKYRLHYPNIWGEYDGKRRPLTSQNDRGQMCFSAPTLVDASIEAARDYFADNPAHEYIAFSVQDNHDFCQCQRCSELRAEHGEVTVRVIRGRELVRDAKGNGTIYWTYLNQVAERLATIFPEKRVVGLAYSGVRLPPSFVLHPNIVVWHVWKFSDIQIDGRFGNGPAGTVSPNSTMLQRWAAIASATGHHDWAHGRGFLIPRFYIGQVQEGFQVMRTVGSPIRYVHLEAYPSWGMVGPFYYLNARLWEDPDADLDAMLTTFCSDMFGPAADPMHAYFTGLEDLWLALNAQQERKLNRYVEQFLTNDASLPLIAACRSHLDAALAAAADSPEDLDRIELFNRCYTLAEKLFAAKANDPDEAAADDILAYAQEHLAADPWTIYRARNDKLMPRLAKALRMAGITRRDITPQDDRETP